MTARTLKSLVVTVPMLALTASTVAMNLHNAAAPMSAHLTTSAASMATGGVMAGACAIAVGAIGGVIALGVGGATLGFGAALAIAATINISAVACAS